MKFILNTLLIHFILLGVTNFAGSQELPIKKSNTTNNQQSQETVITVTYGDGSVIRYSGEQAVKISDELKYAAGICEGKWTGNHEIEFTVVNQTKIDPFKITFRNLGSCTVVALEVSPVIISGNSFSINFTVPTIRSGSLNGTFSGGGNNVSGSFTFSQNSCGSATKSGSWSATPVTPCSTPPTANFSGTPRSGTKPLTVQFSDQSSGNITSRTWNFGDGGSSNQQNPSHTYINAGTYTVSLTVTGPGGSDTRTRNNYISVSEPQNNAPVLANIANQTVEVGTTTNVSLSASDIDGDPLTFSIPTNPGFLSITNISQSGNNATATLVIAPSSSETGSFNATVKVDDGRGGSDSKDFIVESKSAITDLPPAAPQNLVGTAGDGQVTLSWDANAEADFLKYNIYGGTSPNPTSQIAFNVGISNTTKTITYLTNGVAYYFRITAIDSAQQESAFSNEVAVTPGQTFTRVTEGDIVNYKGPSNGCAWGDYNNDGNLDLYVGGNEHNLLYSNNGDGTFAKVSLNIVVLDQGTGAGTWGDYNNDGYLDLYAVRTYQNSLYANNGDGTFTKITSGQIVNDVDAFIGCNWGDYNNDGYLDMLVANGGPDNGNFLYTNNGNGTFTKVISDPFITDKANSICAAWGDYDNDGDLDIFVANRKQNNFLYQNNGDGTFTKITTGDIVSDGGDSWGGSWGDYDNDGDLDLFVTNSAEGATPEKNFLYTNNGDGTFLKITTGDIVNDLHSSQSSSWGDYDNDGDLDLYVTSGNENNLLYKNKGDGTFEKIINSSVVSENSNSGACAWADYDNDGDLDLFVTNSNQVVGGNLLFMNNGNANHWINIKCIGSISNRSAIGTKVRIKATINGNPIWQLNEISGQTGGGAGGQNSLNAEFGLGDATVIDSLVIKWPSGIKQVRTQVPVDQFLSIQEDSTATSIDEAFSTKGILSKFSLEQNYPNPFNPSTVMSYTIPPAYANLFVKLEIYNLIGEKIQTLVNKYQVPGYYQIQWDGKDDAGKQVPSGTYLYRLQAGTFIQIRKMLLIK